jgi:hypothetical protein
VCAATGGCDEAYWRRQLEAVYNVRTLPFTWNARATYEFLCTDSAAEFAFFWAKKWGWMPGGDPDYTRHVDTTGHYLVTAGERPTNVFEGTKRRRANCGRLPDDDSGFIFVFMQFVSKIDYEIPAGDAWRFPYWDEYRGGARDVKTTLAADTRFSEKDNWWQEFDGYDHRVPRKRSWAEVFFVGDNLSIFRINLKDDPYDPYDDAFGILVLQLGEFVGIRERERAAKEGELGFGIGIRNLNNIHVVEKSNWNRVEADDFLKNVPLAVRNLRGAIPVQKIVLVSGQIIDALQFVRNMQRTTGLLCLRRTILSPDVVRQIILQVGYREYE